MYFGSTTSLPCRVEAFGSFVVGGNLVVGLVVFLILTIVQFVVITKGAERVAEVRAAVAALPVDLREALVLFEYEELPQLEVAAIGCGDDALAGAAGARRERERERLACLLRRNDEAREAIGIRLQGERAPADVAEDGGLRRVGREFKRDDLARAVDVGWRENQAKVFRGNRPHERGESERGDEEAG